MILTTEICNMEDVSDKNVFCWGNWRGSLTRVGLRENERREMEDSKYG